MIIVCQSCKATFLVPASLFTAGPRQVRCARCGNAWLEDPHKKKTESQETNTPPPPSREQETKEAQPFHIFVPPPAHEERPEPKGPSLLSRLAHAPWKKIALGIFLFLATATLLAALTFALGRKFVIETWPESQEYYMSLGLIPKDLPAKLILQNVYSERRYMDGAMHLVVNGTIFNQANKTQVVPALVVEAQGPGSRLIQSWHIKPPAATLDPGASVPFFSAIIPPEGAIVEVNLSFVEPPHDKP